MTPGLMAEVPRGRLRLRLARLLLCSALVPLAAKPRLEVERLLRLEAGSVNEQLGTVNQAMNTWAPDDSVAPGRELVVGLVHRYGNLDKRGDDMEFAVAWESDGKSFREVQRVPMACPNVELAVPRRGPYVYEARLAQTAYTVHPECSCEPGTACPPGVALRGQSDPEFVFASPILSHSVSLRNEWDESIADPAVLGRFSKVTEARIAVVSERVQNATSSAPTEPLLACPGSLDDRFGSDKVTMKQLGEHGMLLPAGHVDGKWCVVRRGGCSDTAKAKVCEISGAIGVIIIDHGYMPEDQEIIIRYIRAADEWGRKMPIVFVSEEEGSKLLNAKASTTIAVGPDVQGPVPPGYHPGTGLIVHKMGSAFASNPVQKAHPKIFGVVSWLQASDVRDILFVCMHRIGEVRMYDISNPLEDIPLLGLIKIQCAWAGSHDYRVLDFVDEQGHYKTALIDPMDRGNRLYYYDTKDPAFPKHIHTLHAKWENGEEGLGQVRPGGNGRYHIVTWHCSTVFCGKSHGDTVHVLDTHDLSKSPFNIDLEMLSKGSYSRDVACNEEALCVMSLTWDGVVAIDTGSPGSVNTLRTVATYAGKLPFTDTHVPFDLTYLKPHAGAQKVYASQRFPRTFYVEHADLSVGHVRMGDWERVVGTRDVYAVTLKDYDQKIVVGFPNLGAATRDGADTRGGSAVTGLLLGAVGFLIAIVTVLLFCLRLERRKASRWKELRESSTDAEGVVVGRPVAGDQAQQEPAHHGLATTSAKGGSEARHDLAASVP